MNSALTMTFAALIEGLANFRLGTGTAINNGFLADALNNAQKTVWEMPAGKKWVWPFTVQTLADVALTDGVIPLESVDYARWWALYSADPRGVGSMGYPIPSYIDGDGIHPINNTLATYFVFYIPRTPEFTGTPAAVETDYKLDDIVYDTGRSGSTGECYRCLEDYTSGADDAALNDELADTDQWKVQPVYKNFQSAMQSMASAQYYKMVGSMDAANQAIATGMNDLEQLWKSIRRGANYAPAQVLATGTWR